MLKEALFLVRIDSDYCDYLRKYDKRVPYNFKQKDLRPFVGVLFTVDNYKYFVPLSSPKQKHLKMKNKLDFLKIDDVKLGAINFNNMLPVNDKNVILLDLNAKFVSVEKQQYYKLLKKQIFWLNRNSDKLYSQSKKLYLKYLDNTLAPSIFARCCDFKLLETKCEEYNQNYTR